MLDRWSIRVCEGKFDELYEPQINSKGYTYAITATIKSAAFEKYFLIFPLSNTALFIS